MNPKAHEVLAQQRYHQLAADARGDQFLARAAGDGDRGPGASFSTAARAALFARRRFPAAVRRFSSPAREASGGRF